MTVPTSNHHVPRSFRPWLRARRLLLAALVALFTASALVVPSELPAAATTRTYTVEPLPTPRGSGYSAMASIFCPSVSNCVGVGVGSSFLVETLTAGSWSDTSVDPAGFPEATPKAVWCASVTSCVAVGFYGPDNQTLPFIDSLSDGTWTGLNVELPTGGVDGSLSAITCLSITRCVATGSYGDDAGDYHARFETLSNGKWSPGVSADIAGSKNTSVDSVQCFTDTSCYAVGSWETSDTSSNGLLETLSGTVWTATTLKRGVTLDSLWCSSPTSCLAVGYRKNGNGVTETLGGPKWSAGSLPGMGDGGTGNGIAGVSCGHSIASCVAIGSWRPPAPNVSFPLLLIETLSRGKWTPTDIGPPSGYMVPEGISCPSIKACIGIGTKEASGAGAEAAVEQ
jgi:hypothetical protein